MATPSLQKKEFLLRLLRSSEVSVAMRPIVWFVVSLGVSLVIAYLFANRAPMVVGSAETGADNTDLGTLYGARGEPERPTVIVRHNGSGEGDGPKFASGSARHAWGGATKPGWTGAAAVLPASAQRKRDSLETSQALDAGATMTVQRELRRRGCYAGHVDGDWGPTSRFAAAMFFDESGADVPIDKAEDVLLALSRQPAYRSCREAVDSRLGQTTSPDVQYVAVEVDGAVVDGTTTKRETRRGPRIVGTNGAYIEPAFVEARRSAVDENTTQSRIQKSRAVSTYRKRRRERWKRRVYQGINLNGN